MRGDGGVELLRRSATTASAGADLVHGLAELVGDIGVGLVDLLLVAGSARAPGRSGSGTPEAADEPDGRRDGRGVEVPGHARSLGDGGSPQAVIASHSRARSASAASPAARITASGPGRPVISSTCSTAWCTSRSSPPTSATPAVSAAARQRGRPRVVEHVEDDTGPSPSRSAAAVLCGRGDGRDEHVDRARRRSASRQQPRPRTEGGAGCRATASRVSPARAGSRTTRVAARQPRSPSASSRDAAVAPPPSTSAADRPGYRSRSAATAPGMSVLSPTRRPSSSITTVLAAPARAARRVDLVEQRQHGPLQRHRQRQPAPRGVEPVDERRQPGLVDLDAS